MACIKLTVAECNFLAPCFSITVSSSGSSCVSKHSLMIRKYHLDCKSNPRVAFTCSWNPICIFSVSHQCTMFLSCTDMGYPGSQYSSNRWTASDCIIWFILDGNGLYDRRWIIDMFPSLLVVILRSFLFRFIYSASNRLTNPISVT